MKYDLFTPTPLLFDYSLGILHFELTYQFHYSHIFWNLHNIQNEIPGQLRISSQLGIWSNLRIPSHLGILSHLRVPSHFRIWNFTVDCCM